jgi:transcriptional regulator with XRE-family HTH domain
VNNDLLPGVVQRLRKERGLTVRELASRTYAAGSWVSNVEHGRRWPADRQWAVSADLALGGRGELTAAWDTDRQRRDSQNEVRHLLATSAAATEAVLADPDSAGLDELGETAADLSVRYLSTPPAPMLAAAGRLQAELQARLRRHGVRDGELRDLQTALGRTAGVLSYAALDLGHPEIAARHAELTFRMGAVAGVPELQAWARGTQSLIARFEKDYPRAFTLISDGMRYADHRNGTAGIRLLAGGAQCRANLGDAPGALAMLAEADQARADRDPPDEVGGLFTFSEAKARYYGGSSLMWLPDKTALKRAVDDSGTAIAMWRDEPDAARSLDDEALAHVYEATANARLGDLDRAMEAVRPVLGLPPERRISWLTKRVGELAVHLGRGRYAGSAVAAAVVDELRDWAA